MLLKFLNPLTLGLRSATVGTHVSRTKKEITIKQSYHSLNILTTCKYIVFNEIEESILIYDYMFN